MFYRHLVRHLVPYYPKEPIIFPFIQQYILHPDDYNNENTLSNSNDSINVSSPFSEEQLIEDENHSFVDCNKEKDIPSTIDYSQETINQYSPFPYQRKLIIPTQKINLIFMTMIILLILENTPLTDTISAHNREKTIDLSSDERNIL